APQRIELLAQLCVVVAPGVARQPPLAGPRLAAGRVVAERGRDDRAGAVEERLRVAGDLGSRRREAHVGEVAPLPPLADVPLGVLVRLGRRRADDVDAELAGVALQLRGG